MRVPGLCRWSERIRLLVAASSCAAFTYACVVVGAARAQTTKEAAGAARPGFGLATRYRFRESYSTKEDAARPRDLVQYRVAIRERLKNTVEQKKGAPQQIETTYQTIYRERPAEVGEAGDVLALVRRYETFLADPDPFLKPGEPRLFEGETLWIRPKLLSDPEVLLIAGKRGMRDFEYETISHQISMTELATLLPSLPTRIGDRWRAARSATRALLGQTVPGDPLVATLASVQPDPKSSAMIATFDVTGRYEMGEDAHSVALNARILFRFDPNAKPPAADPKAAPAASNAAPTDDAVSAAGEIFELRMARVTVLLTAADATQRLHARETRDVVLQRVRAPLADKETLALPATPPAADDRNSWLTYDDPQRRFHFRHPESLRPIPAQSSDDVALAEVTPQGNNTFAMRFVAKSPNPALQKRNADPGFFVKALEDEWSQSQIDFRKGPSEWLPEADWKPLNLRVHHYEAALMPDPKAPRSSKRILVDHFFIQTTHEESFIVTATTDLDPPAPYRRKVDAIIKTLRFGSSLQPE